MRELALLCVGMVMAVSPRTGNCQASTASSVQVEVSADKRSYLRGEPINLRVVLVNRNRLPVFLSKQFRSPTINGESSGADLPGFEIEVKQLHGLLKRLPGCALAVDEFSPPDMRSPEQVFREDFLRLPAGGLVGLEVNLAIHPPIGCVQSYQSVGRYQVIASYSTRCEYMRRIESLPHDEKLLDGRYESKPITFTVR